MLTQPINQIVLNTIYFQKLFEKDIVFGKNTPVNEYLSRLINLNLKSLLNLNFNNCILSGFDVSIKNTINNKIYLDIFPGLAILDSYLFELKSIQSDIEIDVNSLTTYLLISLVNSNNTFKFKFDLLDSNKENLMIGDDVYDEILPIKIFKLQYKNNKILLLSLNNENGDYINYGLNSEIFNLINCLYLETEYTFTLSNYTPLNNLYDIPKKHIIDGKEYLIPNYGKHYNFAIRLLKELYQNKIMFDVINSDMFV